MYTRHFAVVSPARWQAIIPHVCLWAKVKFCKWQLAATLLRHCLVALKAITGVSTAFSVHILRSELLSEREQNLAMAVLEGTDC